MPDDVSREMKGFEKATRSRGGDSEEVYGLRFSKDVSASVADCNSKNVVGDGRQESNGYLKDLACFF